MTNIQEITLLALKDFQTCERYFDFKYNDKVPEKYTSDKILEERFQNTIKKIIQFFWYKKQADFTPSYNSLLNKWEKLWLPKGTDAYDILTGKNSSTKPNIVSLTSKAASVLLDFHQEYAESDYIPFGISEEYFLSVTKDIRISDAFDLILFKDGITYVVKFLSNYKESLRFQYQFDFAAMHLGFLSRYGEDAGSFQVSYIDITSSSQSIKKFPLYDSDIEALKYWCRRLSETEVFAPKRGMIPLCKKCPYDKPCAKWCGWKEGKQNG